jgi:hypothetical protein
MNVLWSKLSINVILFGGGSGPRFVLILSQQREIKLQYFIFYWLVILHFRSTVTIFILVLYFRLFLGVVLYNLNFVA